MVDNPLHEPAVWRPLVEALLRSSPPDVRETEFVGSVSSGAYGGSTNYDGDPGRKLDLARGERPMDALGPIADLVDGAGVAIRAVARSTGDGMVSIVAAAPQVTFGMGNQVLEVVTLVPGADPEPFRRTPVHHDGVTVSPGADPDAVTALVRELLPEARPASLAALAAAESRLGAALPEDVRALYLAAGSGELILRPRQEDRFYGLQIVGLDDAAARDYLEPKARYLSWTYGATEVVPPDPHGRVQALGASPAWFVVGDDWGGNLYVVDLAPGPRGTVGQVLFVDHEISSGAQWVAPSLTELLVQRPVDLAGRASEGGLLVRVSDTTLAAVEPETEVLYVRGGPVDLAALAGHSRIRTLSTSSDAVTDLNAVSGLPALEFLELDVNGWQRLLHAGHVPPTLLAAGLRGRADWQATVDVLNGLLTLRGQPVLDVTDVPVSSPRR
ncbi:SMI1/KNR4 family protein [Dactylosporangium sp. NPDC006015]|uniref:SMI1/KNR4 family protein n=1 Tax=Dactylosporangium sp. NPDC006015 TaxID=3154576 RepID=UPI0033AC9299